MQWPAARVAEKANKDAATEYDRLRKYCVFQPCSNIAVDKCGLTVSLLNTRSLKKHAVDIAKESRFIESDYIKCLTETQTSIDDDVSEIEQTRSHFNIHYNTCEHKLLSLAICLCNGIKVVAHERFPGISMIDVLKPSFSKNILRFLLYIAVQTLQFLYFMKGREK